MDRFVAIHHIQQLYKNLAELQQELTEHKESTNDSFNQTFESISSIESEITEMQQEIVQLEMGLSNTSKLLNETRQQLTRSNIIQIKQGIVIRTMHNLTIFDAHSMFIDTFVDKMGIDENRSIRADMIPEAQAIGVTNAAVIDTEQTIDDSSILLSNNGSSDHRITQGFFMEKERLVSTLSVRINPAGEGTFRPIEISIGEEKDGPALVSSSIQPNALNIDGWTEIELPALTLRNDRIYYIRLSTLDPTGYHVGISLQENYLSGTIHTLNGTAWVDLGYDMAFRVWGYKTEDEYNATIYTKMKTLGFVPRTIIFEKDDAFEEVPNQYHVSRDDGDTWKLLQPGIETNLDDLPEGNQILIRGYLTGLSMINAWGYVLTGGES